MAKREDTIKELLDKVIKAAETVGDSGWSFDQGYCTEQDCDEAEIALQEAKAELLGYLEI